MIADDLKKALTALSPFIQRHTSLVCPACERVCCINRHGYHDATDRLFLSALGTGVPLNETARQDTDPCRFLGERGCTLERWMRPFRCTWYFCEPLLKSMEEDGERAHREFTASVRRLVLLRQKLLSS